MKMRAISVVAVASMGLVGISTDVVSAAPITIELRTSGGGAQGEARFISGTGEIRVKITCNSNNVTQNGPWKTINLWSASTCGPQGFYNHSWQGR